MTNEEIEKKRNEWRANELFQQSHSHMKESQLEVFWDKDESDILQGEHHRLEKFGEDEFIVIYRFKDGLLHGEPAIEYPCHWENWENGLITEVADYDTRSHEVWKDGVPVKITIEPPEEEDDDIPSIFKDENGNVIEDEKDE